MNQILSAVGCILLLAGCSAPGGSDGDGGAGGGGGSSIPAPTLTGTGGFDAGQVFASRQGGTTDNLDLAIKEGCGAFGDRSVTLTLRTRDHSALVAGTITVERAGSGTAGNVFANVEVSSFSGASPTFRARSGQVVMSNIDFSSLANNRGTFDVMLDLSDGGASALSGTFDARYLCQ